MKITLKKLSLFLAFAAAPMAAFAGSNTHQTFQSGFYAGQSFGFGSEHGKRKETANYSDTALVDFTIKDGRMNEVGVTGGFFTGYLYRFDDTDFCIALEPSVNFSNTKDRVALDNDADATANANGGPFIVSTIKRTWSIGLPAKLGMVVADDYMVYAILGIDFARYSYEHLTDSGTHVVFVDKTDKVLAGFTYGLGVETEMMPFRIGLEFKNTTYNRLKKSFTANPGSAFDRQVDVNIRPQVFVTQLKVSYLF